MPNAMWLWALRRGRFSRLANRLVAAAAAGRYEGSVSRQSDSSTYLRAVELGAPSGSVQPVRIFDQVSGGLPSTPQASGDALVVGPFLLLRTTDSVANRQHLHLPLGNALLSASRSTYHDGRPEVKLVGVLRKK